MIPPRKVLFWCGVLNLRVLLIFERAAEVAQQDLGDALEAIEANSGSKRFSACCKRIS